MDDGVEQRPVPVFFADRWCVHDYRTPASSRRCTVTGMPYDEREYAWLKTFVNVVSWMEKNFDIDIA